jgi:hypothetical protein
MVFPNGAIGLAASGQVRALVDGIPANATVFQNSTTTSILFTYGRGQHTVGVEGVGPPGGVLQFNPFSLGATTLLLVLAAVGSLTFIQRRRRGPP